MMMIIISSFFIIIRSERRAWETRSSPTRRRVLASARPGADAALDEHMEPFSTSVFKVLISVSTLSDAIV